MSTMFDLVFPGGARDAPRSDVVLLLVGLRPDDVGRFRDAWVERTEPGQLRVAVYTRNGGGNRDHWALSYPETSEGPYCVCPGCIITHRLPSNPLYLSDEDDDFDSTYATVYFRLPTEAEAAAFGLRADVIRAAAETLAGPVVDMDERWSEALETLRTAPLPDGLRHLGERIQHAEAGSIITIGEDG